MSLLLCVRMQFSRIWYHTTQRHGDTEKLLAFLCVSVPLCDPLRRWMGDDSSSRFDVHAVPATLSTGRGRVSRDVWTAGADGT